MADYFICMNEVYHVAYGAQIYVANLCGWLMPAPYSTAILAWIEAFTMYMCEGFLQCVEDTK